MAEAFLQLDVGRDLVQRHVPRAFDHHLDAGVPGALGQLAQEDQFVDLGAVGGVGQAAGAEAVAQGEDRVVGLDDLQQAVEVLVEGVFGIVVRHPLDGEGAAARDHIHDPPLAVHPLDGGAGDAAVDGDEVDAVVEVLDDAGEDVVDGHVDDRLLLPVDRIESRLVEGDACRCRRRSRR